MEERQFKKLAAATGMTSAGVSMAEAVLVSGYNRARVSRAYGVSRQRVGQAVKRIEDQAKKESFTPLVMWSGIVSPEMSALMDLLRSEERRRLCPSSAKSGADVVLSSVVVEDVAAILKRWRESN